LFRVVVTTRIQMKAGMLLLLLHPMIDDDDDEGSLLAMYTNVYLFFIIIFFFYTKQQSIFKRRTTLDVWRRWWLVEFCFHNNKYILFLSRKRSVHVIKCRRNLCREREAVFVRSFHWDSICCYDWSDSKRTSGDHRASHSNKWSYLP
jgi:hypothetical protein